MLRDVQHEAGLSHRRPGRDDDQVAPLEAARHLVEIDEAGRHAGDEPLVLEQLLDFWEAVGDQVAHGHEAGFQPVVRHGEDQALRFVENQLRFLVGLVRVAEDLVRRVDQVPQRRLLFDDLRVVLDVGRARHAVHERRDVGRAADVLELSAARQLLFQRDEVDRRAALVERDHAIEDAPVRVPVEVAAVDHLRRGVEGVVVNENRSEHRAFRLEIMRKRTVGGCDRFGHEGMLKRNREGRIVTRRRLRRSTIRCRASAQPASVKI